MNQRDTTVDSSAFILCFLGGAAVMIIAAAAFYNVVLGQVSGNTASAWAAEDVAASNSYMLQHVVVPPILGDAVAGAQGACGCPGCCSVLNS